jgi:hypothetical protein
MITSHKIKVKESQRSKVNNLISNDKIAKKKKSIQEKKTLRKKT